MKAWNTKSGYSISRILSGRNNAFLSSGNGKTILIDTGTGREWKKLLKTKCPLFLPSHGTANKVDLVKRKYLQRSNSSTRATSEGAE